MTFDPPLLRGALVARYKRFFADVTLDSGETITAHTPNTGAMLTCSTPGSLAYVSPADNPARKLKFTLELVRSGRALVGVHTGRANDLAAEGIAGGVVGELQGYAQLRREVRYRERSRVDILLQGGAAPDCYVEVKSVTLTQDDRALFPDAVTVRGAKHMRELAAMVQAGARAAVLFVVQREDCSDFAPADAIDPAYGEALRAAADAGVAVLAYQVRVTSKALRLARPLPVRL